MKYKGLAGILELEKGEYIILSSCFVLLPAR